MYSATRRSRRRAKTGKPPRATHNTRSVISENTSSTYLSSDSEPEEDCRSGISLRRKYEYSDDDETDEDSLADLDALIQDCSERWKVSVQDVVRQTVTHKEFSGCSAFAETIVEPRTTPSNSSSSLPVDSMIVPLEDDDETLDDLTVWSGFYTHTDTRPDSCGSVVARPPERLQLLSAAGIRRDASFYGTVSSRNVEQQTISGHGRLEIEETGDVYDGDIVDSEMHGHGTYSTEDKTFTGRFEHNVFVGTSNL